MLCNAIHFKINILEKIDEILVTNLDTWWHKATFFLYPPAINMQLDDLLTN